MQIVIAVIANSDERFDFVKQVQVSILIILVGIFQEFKSDLVVVFNWSECVNLLFGFADQVISQEIELGYSLDPLVVIDGAFVILYEGVIFRGVSIERWYTQCWVFRIRHNSTNLL